MLSPAGNGVGAIERRWCGRRGGRVASARWIGALSSDGPVTCRVGRGPRVARLALRLGRRAHRDQMSREEARLSPYQNRRTSRRRA